MEWKLKKVAKMEVVMPVEKLDSSIGNWSKAPDNKPPRIIAKYAVDANLFRLESTNPKKK